MWQIKLEIWNLKLDSCILDNCVVSAVQLSNCRWRCDSVIRYLKFLIHSWFNDCVNQPVVIQSNIELQPIFLDQWFSNLSYKHPCPAHFVCLPYQTHLIQLISSSVETARPELGVPDKGDIQNVQGRGACRTGLKTTVLDRLSRFFCQN